MTAEQRKLCWSMVILPNGSKPMSKEDFLRQFPTAIEHGKLASGLLEEACRTQNTADLDCAIQIGNMFGYTAIQTEILCHLIDADWHGLHESIVDVLGALQPPGAVEALFRVTQWTQKHLEDIGVPHLAEGAIWALSRIPGSEAETKLEILAHSDKANLREAAVWRLEQRHKAA